VSLRQETGADALRRSMQPYILRFKDRQQDWDAFAYEEVADPHYRRAQLRYIGAGGSGKDGDTNFLPAQGFTLSIMRLPPGAGGPPHTHEVEEVFFCLKGPVVVYWWEDGVQVEETLDTWDMIYSPPGVHHSFRNDTDDDAYLQVMLGRGRPGLPIYPDEELERIKRERAAALNPQHGEITNAL